MIAANAKKMMQAAGSSFIPGAPGQAQAFPANMPVPPGPAPPGFAQMPHMPVPPGMPMPPYGFAPPPGKIFRSFKISANWVGMPPAFGYGQQR